MDRRMSGRICALGLSAILAVLAPMAARAQNPVLPPPMEWKPAGDPTLRYLQRSLEIYEFKRAAGSGPERGREIFYFKCWKCHNDFAKQAGPALTGLFERPVLMSGKPVNNDTVRAQILDGSANMAAYKFSLEDADMNDLMSFLREKCCWNDDAPPPNPRYIAR